MEHLHEYFYSILLNIFGNTNTYTLKLIDIVVTLIAIGLLAVAIHYTTKLFIISGLKRYLSRSKTLFLKVIAKNRTLNYLAPLFSSFMFWLGLKVLEDYRTSSSLVINIFYYISLAILLFCLLMIISKLLWSVNDYYEERFEFAEQYPIYSYLKVVILFFWAISLLAIVAALANTSLVAIFTGIGAVSAVFLLVFRDTLLGIMSSIQVTAANIVRIGDRVAINRLGVDGTITDISIMTVKIQNFDNTTSTVPTYTFISEAVQNYRNMVESGGRRFIRSIKIDIETIKDCSTELINSLKKFSSVAEYINSTSKNEYTNLELFRIYILESLKKNPEINQNYTLAVHHLEPTQYGLPLQIYAFTYQTSFVEFEGVQAEIFEHCFAAMPSFELKVLQFANT